MSSFMIQQRIVLDDGSDCLVEIVLPSKPERIYNIGSVMIGDALNRASIVGIIYPNSIPEGWNDQITHPDTNSLIFDYKVSHASFEFSDDSKLRMNHD